MDSLTILYLKNLFDLSNKNDIIEDIDIFLQNNNLENINPFVIYNDLSNFVYNL